MITVRYGNARQLAGLKFDQALELVLAALSRANLTVLTRFDVAEALRRDHGMALGRYVILGVCDTALVYKALRLDCQAGLALPYRVIVREGAEGGIVVAAEDPRAASAIIRSNGLDAIANEVAELLRQFLESLA